MNKNKFEQIHVAQSSLKASRLRSMWHYNRTITKNKIQKLFLATTILLSNSIFANDPDGDGGGVNPTDAPLDANIVLLAVAAIVLCYFRLYKKVAVKQ